MSIDLTATPKDYSLIIYNKTEINTKLSTERLRVDYELANRIPVQAAGSPTGIATLGQDGKHSPVEIPFSAINDYAPTDKVVSPYRVSALVDHFSILKSEKDVPNGVAPLDSTGRVPDANLPPAKIVHTYVVNTIQEMYNLVGAGNEVNAGDRCIVTAEPNTADNGEYVATIDNPVDVNGWAQLPNLSAVQSVNGDTGNVVINATNTPDIQTNIANITIVANASAANALSIATNETDIKTIKDSINIEPALGTDINVFNTNGNYEVNTNTPSNGEGLLVVRQEVGNLSKVIQEYTDINSPIYFRRISSDHGVNWSPWQETPQSLFNTAVATEVDLKASKAYVDNAIVNTYAGTAIPDSSLGKSGDLYHKYVTATSTVVKSGVSESPYNPVLFDIFYDDTEQVGLYQIIVDPAKREVDIDWITATPHAGNYALKLNGTTIPLTIVTNTQLSVVATYDAGYDATIQAVTTATTFELSTDVLSGSEEDYTKYDTIWFLTPIFNHTYDYVKTGIPDTGNPVVITSNSYTPIAHLVTPPRDAGVYEIKFSQTFTYDSTQRSAFFQWSVNGGLNWEEFSIEPKDASDTKALTYEFPHEHTGGIIDIQIMGRCENNNDILTIPYSNIVLERKK